jgi:hypothetical protein
VKEVGIEGRMKGERGREESESETEDEIDDD